MFEFKKLCNEVEKLSPADRGLLLVEKSVSVVKGLNSLDLPFNPVKTLVTFIIGSVVSDGSISEKDYLYIYPSLVKAFGHDFDFMSAKQALQIAKDIKKEISSHTKQLLSVIATCDEDLAADIVSLCLLVTSVDGKVSLKEKRYIRQLCRA
ncbi:MAG: TerB family tellurite resistance protein [Clostridiales bacterium]|nr:TerB family tellurite resistance protein [Clostridiales bacterium]